MKKSTFEILIDNSYMETVAGLLSTHFGIHKEVDGPYTITHLKTGMSLFRFAKLNQARAAVALLEKVPNIETLCKSNSKDFIIPAARIRNFVLFGLDEPMK